jgi:hypothetical protein
MQVHTDINVRPNLKNNQTKKGQGYGSSSAAPWVQTPVPEKEEKCSPTQQTLTEFLWEQEFTLCYTRITLLYGNKIISSLFKKVNWYFLGTRTFLPGNI